jgi:hypothetical protein
MVLSPVEFDPAIVYPRLPFWFVSIKPIMIVSVSRRTDIPAFYGEWFLNRVREGFVLVRHPFRPKQIERVSLSPEDVDALVFWTRNADPLLPYLDEMDSRGYRYYFQYTLVHYPRFLERSSGSLSRKLQRFKRLSERIGPERVIWRYDPVILSNLTDREYHRQYFEKIGQSLKGFTDRCVISFLDVYRKTRQKMVQLAKEENLRLIDLHQDEAKAREISCLLSEIGQRLALKLLTCAEPLDLEDLDIRQGKCIDDDLIRELFGLELSLPKDKGQRRFCRCVESKDIGAYDTCPHGCVYCYANTSDDSAQRNYQRHDARSPMLL